jgi:HK97 family phage major capsid protein
VLGTPGKDQIVVHELSGLVKLGTGELNDSPNLGSIIQNAVVMKFAEVEDDAFAFGSGGTSTTSRPAGFAWRATAAGGPLITQGVTAGASATITTDALRSLMFQIPAQFRNSRAAFYASDDAAAAIALLKDGQQNYFQTDPTKLFGYDFVNVSGMPSMSTAGVTDPSVMFGDLYSAYMICDNGGLSAQVLRERYADEGKIGIIFKRRTGSDVIRPLAMARYLL